MLCSISLQHNLQTIDSLLAHDFMDDGCKINLKLTINRYFNEHKRPFHLMFPFQRTNDSATFDFSGTDFEVYGKATNILQLINLF